MRDKCRGSEGPRTRTSHPPLTIAPLSPPRVLHHAMEFLITPEWVAGLRRDMQAWHMRMSDDMCWDGEMHQYRPWGWPDMTPPLNYAGSEAEMVRIQLRQTRILLTLRHFRDQERDNDERAPV